jgi:hypothetical protein
MMKSKNSDHLNLLCDIGEQANLIIGSSAFFALCSGDNRQSQRKRRICLYPGPAGRINIVRDPKVVKVPKIAQDHRLKLTLAD